MLMYTKLRRSLEVAKTKRDSFHPHDCLIKDHTAVIASSSTHAHKQRQEMLFSGVALASLWC